VPRTPPNVPFLSQVIGSGSVVLCDERPRELILGCAGRLHQIVDQAIVRFGSRDAFDAFGDPDCEKLIISLAVEPTDQRDEWLLVLEHATRPLSRAAERKFRRYWLAIKPTGAFVSRRLLDAVAARAEAASVPIGANGVDESSGTSADFRRFRL
jgi:hypothetical protein